MISESKKKKISESTIHRLSLYYRVLSILEKENYETVSSKELAKREKLTPAQVRKDLSFFGSFGTRGLGYPVSELKMQIAEILGLNRGWNVALIGVLTACFAIDVPHQPIRLPIDREGMPIRREIRPLPAFP